MADYYVIRDKNTGLYFRGKGVNRWGKYYNQATIYRGKGTAEYSVSEISMRGEEAEVVPIKIIEQLTDVVSKETHEAVLKALQAFVETDVVPVVRCKDCKHYIAGFCTRDINGRTNMFRMSENDFCSYGIRRADKCTNI